MSRQASSPGLEQVLLRAWTRRGPLAWLLWPLSLLYRLLFALRSTLYRRGLLHATRLPVPVIVVGNVVAGGGGKTPTVLAIVNHLRQRGLRPGVLSRGYGRREADCREVFPDSPASEVGDEPLLIRRACGVPVFVAPQRATAGQTLLARHPDVQLLVCDDGLQHAALQRDIEVCVLDDRGIGNGWLLPAGPLREPWPRPVDLILHTSRKTMDIGYGGRRALADHARRVDGTAVPLATLHGRPLLALAGIARPQAFFDMLRAQGLTLAHTIALPDHYDFAHWSDPRAMDRVLLCTEKDAVKLWQHHPEALAVALEFAPEPAFLAALDRALAPWFPASTRAPLSSPDGHQTT